MEISLLKKPSTLKLSSKNISIAIDPKESTKGDVVLTADKGFKPGAEQKVFAGAGEYEVNDTMIDGVTIPDGIAFGIEADGVRMAWLSSSDNNITDSQQEALSPVDVLLLPATDAASDNISKLVSMFEPRIIIPVGGSEATLKLLATEFGITPEKLPKIKITARDLPQDAQKLIVLE